MPVAPHAGKRAYGSDHQASLAPRGAGEVVGGVRDAEAAVASGSKERNQACEAVRATFEKGMVPRLITASAVTGREMLTTKRPGIGTQPSAPSHPARDRHRPASGARALDADHLLEQADLASP